MTSHRVRPGPSRLVRLVVPIAVVAVGASACGGSTPKELTGGPSLVGNGKQYSYTAAHEAKSQWPKPCSLLPQSSAESVVNAAVQVRRFHASCYYQPFSASYPTLTVMLVAVGTGSGSSYDYTRRHTKHITSIPAVGEAAYLHPVRHLPATRLEVHARYAYFTVTVQSPVAQRLSATRARSALVGVGRVISKEFAG